MAKKKVFCVNCQHHSLRDDDHVSGMVTHSCDAPAFTYTKTDYVTGIVQNQTLHLPCCVRNGLGKCDQYKPTED